MKNNAPSLKHRLHEIIYEADTPAGKLFDIALLFLILFSVILVMLESVSWIGEDYAELLYQLEWGITALFSIEYIARLLVVKSLGAMSAASLVLLTFYHCYPCTSPSSL